MDNKKVYQIQINGVTESVDAVESLNKQLDALDKRITALSNATINIKTNADTTTTTSGNGSKSRASSLSEEEKLLNQINTLEEKRVATEKEVYQGYLAAKDVLKETESMQKQIAAQERLQANNYANTMDGLKQRLADLKSVHFKTDIDSDEFKNQTKEIKATTDALKKLEEEYGVFGRSVGNYERAAEGFRKIKVQVGETTREYENFRQAVKDLTEERMYLSQAVGTEAKAYKDVDIALKRLKSDYADLNASSKFMDTMLDTMKSFTALASVGQGLSSLFGVDNAKFQESMQKLVSLSLVLQGVETLMKDIEKEESILGKGLNRFFETVNLGFDNIKTSLSYASLKLKDFTKELFEINLGKVIPKEKYDKILEETFSLPFEKQLKWIVSKVESAFTWIGEFIASTFTKASSAVANAFRSMAASNNIFVKGFSVQITAWMARAANGLRAIASLAKVAATAVMTLGMAFLVMILPEVLNWFSDLIKSFQTAQAEAKRMEEALNTLNAQLKTRMELLRSDYMRGVINDEEFLTKMYKEQASALNQQIELLAKRSRALQKNFSGWSDFFNMFGGTQNTEFTGQRFTDPTTVGAGRFAAVGFDSNDLEVTVHNIEQVENAWHKANQALEQNKDYLSAWAQDGNQYLSSFIVTASDTEEVMRGLGNIKLSDFIAQFQEASNAAAKGKISAEEYADELYKLKKEMNDNEVLASVIANLDKYIPDEKVREQINNIINDIVRLDDAFNQSSEQQIHYWNTVCIEGMKKGWERTKAQLEEEERYEIVQHGRTEEQIQMIRDKYRRKREEAQEAELKTRHSKSVEWAKRLAELEEELQLLRLNNLKAGLDKQLKLIEFNRAKELRTTKDKLKELGVYNKKWKDFEYEINVKYDKLIVDEKRKWSNEMLKIYQDLSDDIAQVNRGTFEKESDTAVRKVEVRTQVQEEQIGTEALGLGLPETASDVNAWEEYYTKVFEVRKQAIERQTKIEQERIEKEYDYNKQEETIRHERFLADDSELQRSLDEGKITREQYDKLIEDENDAHYARMKAIDVEYATSVEETTRNELNDVEQEYLQAFDEILNVTADGKDKVDEIIGRSPKVDDTWGIVLLSQTRRTYKQALEYYDNYKKALKAKQAELLKARESGTISSKEAAERQKALDAEVNAVDEAVQEVKQKQSELIADFMGSVNQYAQQVGQTASSILSSLSDIMANQFEAEIAAQERFIEKYEENLEKQKDATQQYADAVSEIEGNLKEARGDARQYLLDNLNAQVAAQRASLAQEKKIEKEKEKAEERKKKLEHGQAVAKKKADVAQALINASMAISYAAINKYPIPAIPMMALAAAAGAAQVAAIQSQQIPSYGEGGRVIGKSHAEGGVKALVGTRPIELEGQEYVIRKKSTTENIQVLDFINKSERKLSLSDFVDFYSKNKIAANVRSASPTRVFADGGTVPTLRTDIDINDRLINVVEQYANRETVVSVQEIVNVNDNLNRVKVLSGLEPSTI